MSDLVAPKPLRQPEQIPGERAEYFVVFLILAVAANTDARHDLVAVNVEAGAAAVNNGHTASFVCRGPGTPKNNR
jgi:hypothetical protein